MPSSTHLGSGSGQSWFVSARAGTLVARRELLDRLPRGLAAALADHDALIEEIWSDGPRVFLRAGSRSGALFARFSHDRLDEARYAHELAARREVGTRGLLRTPVVLDSGPGWFLEVAVEAQPCRGAHAIDTVVAAASAVADLRLPNAPRTGHWYSRAWRTLSLISRIRASELRYADYHASLRALAACRLPLVTSHGDFRPENVLLHAGAAWVVDWEYSGRRPAGYDLMQFWCELEREGDRGRLFASVLELVGVKWRNELERLRYAVVVRTVAEQLLYGEQGRRAQRRGERLSALLSEARRTAGAA